MPHFNVAKAVRSNPIYGRHVRWIHRFGEVIAALGCKPDSAVAFAECVAAWQGANGLKSDGMLGPKTWTKLKRAIPYGAPMLPAPEWLRLSPEAEGWIDAIVATLKDDTTFLSLSHGAHSVKHKDFTDIAEFIADGTIEVVPVNSRGASYEFRNTEADADSLKTPRRSSGPWRVTQALVIHEAVHAISDLRLRGVEVLTLDEEAFAFVVQGMFLERHKQPATLHHDAPTKRLKNEARALAVRYLAGEIVIDPDWEPLREAIRKHPIYRPRFRKKLKFDGLLRDFP
jgi:hypothetical protein